MAELSMSDVARFPDAKLCLASEAHLASLSTPAMVNHCKRTYRFAMALAAKAALRPDREVLYIASLFHDLGLASVHAESEGDFETVGGNAAAAFLRENEARERLAEEVKAAIELHTSLASAEDRRPEVALLHMGAMVDVVGMRLDEIPEAYLHEVLEIHPRLGCKELLIGLLTRQVERKPASNVASLFSQFKLPELIANAPFSE